MSIREQVHAIIAEQAVIDVTDVADDKTLEELGIDSLGLVESIFAIEEAFDIAVPFNAKTSMRLRFGSRLCDASWPAGKPIAVPEPALTAMYCWPSIAKEIGAAWMPVCASALHSFSPVSAR